MRGLFPQLAGLSLLAALGHGAGVAVTRSNWYDGLAGVKVLDPGDPDAQEIVNSIWKKQEGWDGHFNVNRYAVLLTPGDYPDLKVPVSYYTSVLGVGASPSQVRINAVRSLNGANGHATNNFWRSVEGVTLTNDTITWAVSQGAPLRRSVVNGKLALSDEQGYASGGFIADVKFHSTVNAGMQQQWLFRNTKMEGGIWCPTGWNYVFVGVDGLDQKALDACQGSVPGKVTVVEHTPRLAEKPYLVREEDASWHIYVPRPADKATRGNTVNHPAASVLRLNLDTDVFIAKPGHSVKDILEGMKTKRGLLFAPGVYALSEAIVIRKEGFVVLGIGFATLIPTAGNSAIEVADGLSDVRVAGLLLEAGTPRGADDSGDAHQAPTRPLLRWGAPGGSARPRDAGRRRALAGVLSDVFARIGSFRYRGCQVVKADTMLEVNSDDVVLDNTWLWHADHDDCGTDPQNSLNVTGKSDACVSRHGLVVNGRRVTAYGTAVEHVVGGDMVSWNGEDGEVYFYQSELPYHNDSFSENGFVAYAAASDLASHAAFGMGVYIIAGNASAKRGYRLPETARVQNLMTVVVIGEPDQFENTLCLQGTGKKEKCLGPQQCFPENRCFIGTLADDAAPEALFLQGASGRFRLGAPQHGGAAAGVLLFALSVTSFVGLLLVAAKGGQWRSRGRHPHSHMLLSRPGEQSLTVGRFDLPDAAE